jgi:hypothetical protein
MTDKLIRVDAKVISASPSTYLPKQVNIVTPGIVTSTLPEALITTNVADTRLNVVVSNMGEEVIPNPNFFVRGLELIPLANPIALKVQTGRSETLNLPADTFSKVVAFVRHISDTKNFFDTYKVFNVSKTLQDLAPLVSQTSLLVHRPITSSSLLSDTATITPNKHILSTTDNYETLEKYYGKEILNSTILVELFKPQVSYIRNVYSTIHATDDFLGESNIDDDQTAYVGKTALSNIYNTDSSNYSVHKYNLDLANTNSIFNISLDKLLLDSNGISEVSYITLTKLLNSSSSISTETKVLANKIIENTSTLSSLVSISGVKVLNTEYSTFEQTYLSTGKTFEHSYNISDTFQYVWEISRDFSSFTNHEDALKFDASKALITYFELPETVSIGVNTSASDTYLSADAAYLSPIKSLSSSISSVLTNVFVDIAKQLSTPYSLTDIASTSSAKVLLDRTTAQEHISTVSEYYRSFSSSSSVTDDFLGESNIDDDQVAYVNKIAVETLEHSELSVFNTFKILPEFVQQYTTVNISLDKQVTSSLTSTQILSVESIKAVVDSYTASDVFNIEWFASLSLLEEALVTDLSIFAFTKSNNDTAQLSTIASIYLNKNLSSLYAIQDQNYNYIATSKFSNILSNDSSTFISNKNILNTAYSTELPYIDISKKLISSTEASELISISSEFYRSLNSSLYATDDFLGQSNVDDDQTVFVIKAATDLLLNLDNNYFEIDKPILNSITTGSINSINLAKPVFNTSQADDVYTSTISKFTLTEYEISDSFSTQWEANKPVENTISSQLFSFQFQSSKPITDQVPTSDLPSVHISIPVESISLVGDELFSIEMLFPRSFNETVPTQDSGYTNNQSYFAGNFVTPGYVGKDTYFS